MGSKSSIEWTDVTWNPVRGCTIVSPGCVHCYAMKQGHRFSGEGRAYHGLTELGPSGPQWTGVVRMIPEMLDAPLHWKKPSRVFVNSMSDLFHEDVPDSFIDRVLAVMALCPQHTFQVLTKRSKRMRKYLRDLYADEGGLRVGRLRAEIEKRHSVSLHEQALLSNAFEYGPLPNVWIGVSVENRQHGLPRIDDLRATPAAVRFLSIEPLLEDPGEISLDGIHWVIIGGESGPGARPFHLEWVYDTKRACQESNTALFVKQFGANVNFTGEYEDGGIAQLTDNNFGGYRIHLKDRKGGDMSEWPEDLRIRMQPGEKWA